MLCNTKIGNNVVVGAGSIVTKDLPSNGVYAGQPAKYICSIEEYKDKYEKISKERPNFNVIRHWNTWQDASDDERNIMNEMLKDGVGFF